MLPNNNSELNAEDRDHKKEYINLGMAVYLVGNCFRAGAVSMFARANCWLAKTIEEADLVCFLGGEDVDPRLYGEEPLGGTYINPERDRHEIEVYNRCLELDIPMFGICRGMQFIHVMSGGRLYQHVNNHGRTHEILDLTTQEKITASSMHHQMCIAFDGCIPVATAKGQSGAYYSFKDGKNHQLLSDQQDDLEAAYYPKINAFCVQGHPEVSGYERFTEWSMERIADMVAEQEDTETYTVKKDAA